MRTMKCLLFCWFAISLVQSQDCFEDYRAQGIQAYEELEFQSSIDLFEAAKICPDNTDEQVVDIDEWLTRARRGYIDAIVQARDEAIRSEQNAIKAQEAASKQALLTEANRLAYLSTQELLKDNLNDALPLAYKAMELVEDDPVALVEESFGNMVGRVFSKSFGGHSGPVENLVFLGKEGGWLTHSTDKSLRIWKDHVNTDPLSIHHNDMISALDAGQNHDIIVTGDQRGNIHVWTLDGKNIQTFQAHAGTVTSIQINDNSKSIVSGGKDGIISMWNSQGDNLWSTTIDDASVLETSISASGDYVLARLSNNQVALLRDDGIKLTTLRDQKHIYRAQFIDEGRHILTSSASGQTTVWGLNGQKGVSMSHSGMVYEAVYNGSNNTILTASTDNVLRLWNKEGQLLRTLSGPSERIKAIAMTDDGNIMAAGDMDGNVIVWNDSGQQLFSKNTGEAISAIDLTDNGQMLLTASEDGLTRLYSLQGEILMTFDLFSETVRFARFSDDERSILAGSDDGTARVIRNPKIVFEELQANPPAVSEDQINKYGLK